MNTPKLCRLPLSLLLILGFAAAQAREAKEYDRDVNYDEARLPTYDLPPLLLTAEGKKITTAEEWLTIRRPQIMSLFGNLVYGRVPEPQSPIKTTHEVVKEDEHFMGGKATRKDVKISFSNDFGKATMLVLVFVPNSATKPVPCFMKHSFINTKQDDFDASTSHPGKLNCGWPLGEFFDRGYGFVAVY